MARTGELRVSRGEGEEDRTLTAGVGASGAVNRQPENRPDCSDLKQAAGLLGAVGGCQPKSQVVMLPFSVGGS